MAILINPPSYLTLEDFNNSVDSGYDLTKYNDAQKLTLIKAATGKADAIMRRSLLPEERTKRVYGDGSSRLNLDEAPLLYIKQARFAIPGSLGFSMPANQLLIDYNTSEILEFTPFVFSGLGYTSTFPSGVPIDVTLATGYGYAVPAPTDLSIADSTLTGITPGSYDIAVTSLTMNGESTATPVTATTSGSFAISFAPVKGAFGYRVYIAPQGTTPLKLVAEVSGAQFASLYGGYSPVTVIVATLALPAGTYAATLPTEDTTAQPFPAAVVEATRILAIQMLHEYNNLANRGIAGDKRQDGASTQWRGVMGSEGKGMGWMTAEALRLLSPYSYQQIA